MRSSAAVFAPDLSILTISGNLFKGKPHIAFADIIFYPQNNPFPTPSGKIEIFSKRLYDMHHPEIPALSHYVPAHEGPEDKLTEKYPLQLIT